MKGSLFNTMQRLIPSSCCACQKLGHHSLLNLCSSCQKTCQYARHSCARCALPLVQPVNRCGNCLKHPPAFDAAFSAFIYQPPISQLIPRIKQGVDQCALPALSAQFCARVKSESNWLPAQLSAEMLKPSAEILELSATILPIPLHWRRYLDRGFNQSLEFSYLIGQELGLAVDTGILHRVRHTPAQQGLQRSARLGNLKAAFQASGKVKDRTFILFDDVMTTGSTMNAAAKALKTAGAKKVIAWSLARTPKY